MHPFVTSTLAVVLCYKPQGGTQAGSSVPKNYQHNLALAFAVEKINENPNILPNISLGFHILNSHNTARMTYKATLSLFSAQRKFAPNFKCDAKTKEVAVIGGLLPGLSANMAAIITIYKMPQLTYGSYSPVYGDKTLFPSLYQMVPSEAIQYKGVVQLFLHFRWIWIGLIVLDNDSGDKFLHTVLPVFSQNGLCFAFIIRLPKDTYIQELIDEFLTHAKYISRVMENKVKTCFVYGEPPSMLVLRTLLFLAPMFSFPPLGKVWVVTSQWDFETMTIQRTWDIQIFHGAISFAVHSNQPPGFHRFLQVINPSWAKGDGFIKNFWEQAFNCLLEMSSIPGEDKTICTGEEKLDTVPNTLFEMNLTGHSYNVYSAVYAVAHALHAIYLTRYKPQRLIERKKLMFEHFQPWQLHEFLKSIMFNNSAGDTIHFDENGELKANFDIINWVTFSNGSFLRVKVGSLDPKAPQGRELTLTDDQIVWHGSFNQVLPLSICNGNCHPGTSKQKKEGEKFCCYDCVACPEGMVSEQNDIEACIKCSEDHYSNKDKNQCIPKSVSYLSHKERLGVILDMLSISFALITAVVLRIFIKHQDTPIVKANNPSLTYTLLISLLFCFLCSLLFIGKPQKVTCLLRLPAFSTIFCVALSAVLAKTMTVVLAFMATKPGSRVRKWVGKRMANSIVLSCSFVQVAFCILWLNVSRPFPDIDLYSITDKIVLECNEGSATMFFCALGYMGFLAIVSFTVAFFARRLPDSFNEAKFITFSMLVFCSVWLSFVPAYFSTKGKYVVTLEIFSILSSSIGLLGCIFSPKCYIIVLRPELNDRKILIRRKT